MRLVHPRPHRTGTGRARLRAGALGLAATVVLAGCGSGGGDDGEDVSRTLTVVTHDSWNVSEELIAAFEEESGIEVDVRPSGDAGSLTNRLVLTRDSPIADGVYGIDNTFGSRAVEEGVLAPVPDAAVPPEAERFRLPGGEDQLVPIDYGDVCVNVDDTWFEREGIEPPQTLADLVDPTYADLFVTPGASTSSPGLAFLLATVAEYGEDWPDYWSDLTANGARVTSGWSDAYEVDFTAGSGQGDRPIVLSYASSPPFTVPEGGSEPTTSALLETCFRQVEYAGVLEGAGNPDGMRQFIDFMLGTDFQEALPEGMYVYPVADVELPTQWAAFAEPAEEPYAVDPAEIAANREDWVREWRDVVTR